MCLPQLNHPKRITPPPPLSTGQALEPSEPSPSATIPCMPPSYSPMQSADGEAMSPSAMPPLGTSPLFCSSPQIRFSPRDRHGNAQGHLQEVHSLTQSQKPCALPTRAESAELSQLPPVVPSSTPSLLAPGVTRRGRSTHMQCSDEHSMGCSGSGIRPFPDLALDTDASSERSLPSPSKDTEMQ